MALQTKHQDITFGVGDTVRVHQQITEKDKTRIQVFEGLVLGIKGRGAGKTFTVRRIGIDSVGVERIWPVNSPLITKIEVKRQGNPRRAKLFYLRDRKGGQALRVAQRK